ncbi:MAG: DUF2911 domain-containing protein [Saprospiraceae bacterium]|nr:DUF2911 domain-containing protein [Saprospiraceae bacterium]
MKNTILISLLLLARALPAQFLHAPPSGDNQQSTVSQSMSGIATVTVQYNSPDVNGRQGRIWGRLVPYGQVWRAGANENTTIQFSTAVRVEGHAVPAGSYGLFMIPGETEWTVILSKANKAWGAFAYDEKEDLLRFPVKPEPAAFHEYLNFEFTLRQPDATVLALQWEELAIPFRIEVPALQELVLESFKAQLKSEIGLFFWEGSHQAAKYCLDHDVALEQGLAWATQSVRIKAQFTNLITKSELLEKAGRSAAAKAAHELAFKMAGPNDLYYHGRSLLDQLQPDEAMTIFKQNYERYGDLYLTHLGLGRGYKAKGEYALALRHLQAALQLAELPRHKSSVETLIAEVKKQQAGGG